MKRFSTQCVNKIENKTKTNREDITTPRKQTIDFLSQFARVYKAEKTLTQQFCGYVLN